MFKSFTLNCKNKKLNWALYSVLSLVPLYKYPNIKAILRLLPELLAVFHTIPRTPPSLLGQWNASSNADQYFVYYQGRSTHKNIVWGKNHRPLLPLGFLKQKIKLMTHTYHIKTEWGLNNSRFNVRSLYESDLRSLCFWAETHPRQKIKLQKN